MPVPPGGYAVSNFADPAYVRVARRGQRHSSSRQGALSASAQAPIGNANTIVPQGGIVVKVQKTTFHRI